MKISFNPDSYYELKNVRNKISKYISRYVNKSKILDIGCGRGDFSYSLAKYNNSSYINGIDIVESYIDASRNKFNLNNLKYTYSNYENIDSSYDCITMFLSLCDLLRFENFENIIGKLDKILRKNGYLIICDEIIDDLNTSDEILGNKILQKLGYKYLNLSKIKKVLNQYDYDIVDSILFSNLRKKLNVKDTEFMIHYENKLNEFDNSKKYESDYIYKLFETEIKRLKGITINNNIRLLIIKKKDNIKFQFDTPSFIFDIDEIKKNIKYYSDFKKNFNVDFLFPVKVFPHQKILELFYNFGYGFDISNDNEYELVKRYKKANIMSSNIDVDGFNKNTRRINVSSSEVISHLGNDIDKKSYENFHIHLSSKSSITTLKNILNILTELDFSKTKILNLGGSYENFSYLEMFNYITQVRNIIPEKVKIVLEMGEGWFVNSGYFVASVVKINNVKNSNIVFINSCRDAHNKWSNPQVLNKCKGDYNYIICGSSCYEKDIFCPLYENKKIEIGDAILFENISPYSFSWNTSFNGIDKAKVNFYER